MTLEELNVRRLHPLRGAAVGIAAALALLGAGPAFAAANGPHAQATAALHDLQAAVAELDHASSLTVSDETPYKAAAQRALNAVVGEGDSNFKPGVGNPGDRLGALGHLNILMHEAGDTRWKSGVAGALVNASVAQSRLLDTLESKELDDFQLAMTGALEALDVALGRDSATGALGGLQGALATTALGVPEGAATVSGCAEPARAPAYGVTDGYLLYVALPDTKGGMNLPQPIGVEGVSVKDGMVVLYTAASAMTREHCAPRVQVKATATAIHTMSADPAKSPSGSGSGGLYTERQAEAGRKVAEGVCAACHGPKLQGNSGPAIAGTAFMKKAKALGWSVHDLRSIVINTMPRNNPGSLEPKQYADVLAYLLAVNCFPAGHNKFPTKNTPQLDKTGLNAPSRVKPKNTELGTCPLQSANAKGAQTTGTK